MTNVIDIRVVKPSFEAWLKKYEAEIIRRLPYDRVATIPSQVTLPSKEHRLLRNDHMAAILSLLPTNRIPAIKIRLNDAVADLPVQVAHSTDAYSIEIFEQIEARRQAEDSIRHLQYALFFARSICEAVVLHDWNNDTELGFANMATGFFSDDEPRTGKQLLERFSEIASNNSPISYRAGHYRKAYGTESGEYVLKEAAEVLAVYITRVAYNGAREGFAHDPFVHHRITRAWCEDYLGMCITAPSAHD